MIPVAHAAEVSPASQVETSPGLSPEAVKRVFDQQRQALASCMRLLTEESPKENTPWNPPPDVDDRVLLSFEVGRDGKVREDARGGNGPRVEGLYLDRPCARMLVRSWSFPAFPARQGEWVRVELQARFSTTAAERKAGLARIREDFDALCRALSALGGDKPPTEQDVTRTLQRFLTERRSRLHPSMRYGLEGLSGVNVRDMVTLYESSAIELLGTPAACPTVHGWTTR
ncbi:hypothetical protein JRI60_20495 [Archangium violaceum]|uniref:hypothetical protein n=1 Tax=Archangium violaceum TaxID=83451 RepID=UPI001952789C|nr:hypothetical protein [Archangium violaceum]QRO01237.1 hypothetical protein JRI60_20495 [Archangium violaceum]